MKTCYWACRSGLMYAYYRLFQSWRSFTFQGRTYRYCYRLYNRTWTNERVVEVPIVWAAVRRRRGGHILEVGNVLGHYFPIDHDVLDAYENGARIIREDVCAFHPARPYDLIVSISTLEHVGFDEALWRRLNAAPEGAIEATAAPDSGKLLDALSHLRALLAPGGEALVTLPLGFNPVVRMLMEQHVFPWQTVGFLKRVSGDNAWEETDWAGVRDAAYSRPWCAANGLIIGSFGSSNRRA